MGHTFLVLLLLADFVLHQLHLHFLLHLAVALQNDVVILGITLVTHGFEDGCELWYRGEMVLECLGHRFAYLLGFINAHDAVDNVLRTHLLKVMVDFLSVRVNPAGDDMDVVVVGVVVAIYQEGLSGFAVAHLTEVLMGYLDQFFLGVFVAPA